MTLLGAPDPPGATPLTPEDVEGLLPTWVATRADLNQVEQANIEVAVRWAFIGRKLAANAGDIAPLVAFATT